MNKEWSGRWFRRRGFADFLIQDLTIRRFIEKGIEKTAAVGKVEIERRGETLKIILHSAKPGILIGRAGSGLLLFKEKLMKAVANLPKQTEIEVQEISEPDLKASLLAVKIAQQLEGRMNFRRTAKMALDRLLEARIKGAKIILAGRLGGAEIAREVAFKFGALPTARLKEKIDFAKSEAQTKWGTIGIKVWIYKGE
ncbi:30S ribosomal protein S3 [Candidatus Berkelbacteria bacterium]|nr:30S ribosomal protein S3 [Candidatus Berkelbacteria bacterium]MBI4029742.1 30S ribosomal protein S3 [Candidatus Berkelbacteria bacterium]